MEQLHKHCISNEFWLMEGYVQGALQKELHSAPFVERFKIVLLINFVSTWNNLLKHCVFNEFWLMEGYLQGALRKEQTFLFS